MTKAQRFEGCIIVGAIGDAYGSYFENIEQEEQNAAFYLFGQPKKQEPVWQITDDTQLTLATCNAIIEDETLNPSIFAKQYLQLFQARKLSGLGSSTLKALQELNVGGHWSQVGRRGEFAAGNGAAMRIAPLAFCENISKSQIRDICSITHNNDEAYVGAYSIGDRTRAFLKVQDGCDYKCTYCTIPLARGISRSDTLDNVLKNAKEISAKGIKEIVLTGVNIGDYGKGEFGNKKHEHTFLELVKALDTVDGIHRLRISSIEPNLLKNETIDFVSKSDTFVPHFHIPLQSGSDEILKKMKRRYLRKTYTDRVLKIKEMMPNACIGVDVIVGFPGETDELFLETYNYLNKMDISYLHVFTYSERPNTEAVEMDGIVPKKVRAKRSKMLRGLSAKKKRIFYESQLGNTLTVLFENENKKGYIHGFTENYVKVKSPWNPELVNTLHTIKLTKIDEDGLVRFDFSKKYDPNFSITHP